MGSCFCLERGVHENEYIFNREMTNELQRANTMDEVMQIVEEEVELSKTRISTRIKSFFKDRNQTSARSNMKLKFMNKISQVILTGDEIKGKGDTPIEVALVDDPTGSIVDDGPEASARVQIVLLKGEGEGEEDSSKEDDWTVKEFNENIVPEMEGKQPLLAGNVPLKLQRGVGVLENIKLRHHAVKIRPSVFKLGARSVDTFDGVRIKEAKTESFTVKDFRNKYYKKHEIPSLSDKVSRLVNIRKGGKIDKRLQDNEIYTVEDFLIRLLINLQSLRSFVSVGEKKWKATVKNAQACASESRMYCYINLEKKIGVVFNVLGQVLGLYLESHYSPTSMLSEKHKADAQDLLTSAYTNWENVKPFDDFNSLQQHLTGLSTYVDSVKPDYPEMVGESSSRRSNISFHSANSTMDSFRELTHVDDFSSSGTYDVDVDIMYDAVMHSPSTLKTFFRDFEEFLPQKDGCNNGYEQSVGADVTFVESEVVQTINPPRRWKKLLCVSRWFSIRKKVSVDVTRNRKKLKTGQR